MHIQFAMLNSRRFNSQEAFLLGSFRNISTEFSMGMLVQRGTKLTVVIGWQF